ncbi:phage tail protein [Streptomyces sp. NY05-11A]|uniref:phage tail protein n=1 Tax=Streptomyces soliscabiei TaxID=588897 RepID=UPI0029B0DBA9|nr:hypothetical protein [Streptomyces sp. NY05-11A]MDX2678035.1 hypothetical protein [Streptomyces sp. NY05-11A]
MKAAPDKGPSARTSAAPARPAAPAQAQARPTAEGSTSPTTAAGPEAAPPAELTPQQLRLLQTGAGNAAVARLVVQRQAAAAPSTAAPAPPVKQPPSASPAFQGLKSEVRAKKTAASRHAPAAAESEAAQKAAVAPPDDKQAQGKAAQAEKMNAAKPGTFDKAAFIAAVNQAIAAQAPKNLDEADHFSGSGKAEAVKNRVSGQVGQSKAASAKEIDTATKAAPDLSKAKDKPVTPLTPDAPPPVPGAPNPAGAVPARQPDAVTDFSGGPQQINQQLADAEVTEDQLAKSNEPRFTEALGAKKEGEKHSATAPGQARGAEARQLAAAKQGAAAVGAQAMTGLAAARTATGKQVDGGKGATKSADEGRRAEVTARLQKVFDGTKTDVERTLSGLDKLVDERFTAGEKAARDAFMADQKRRMDAYKDKRYSGWTGKLKWVKDKFAGLPEEANQLFQESRKLYVAQMQNVISSIADVIGTELGKAKDRIARGRAELKAEVDRLPADLKKFGQQAAKDFTEKFDGLQADVDAKSDQLVQDLAQKYTQALNAVDDEIKKLQEENKGLIAKAKDAVVGVIQTIIELKNMLLGVLAKAATAVMNIIKDPIGFLRNLVNAVSTGLHRFVGNIAEHLKKGLVSWLLGTAVSAGLSLPAKFDLKGILQVIGGLLGLTWANIRARITRKGVPDQAVTAAEQSVPVAQALQREGPAGAVEHIKESVGDLKSTILQKLTSYLIPTVIVAGITWIVSLLNPASAFVRAVKGIIDIVTFVVTQGAQLIGFVNSVLDAVVAIASGGEAGVPALIEGALAASIPVLIGFLAALLGVGNLAAKVKQVFHAVAKPVNKAIDKIVDFIAKTAKKLWAKFKAAGKKVKDKFTGEDRGKDKDRTKSKDDKNESAALAAADQALAKADSHEAAATGVRAAERKHDVPLRLVVDSRTPEGEVVHVQTARTPQHTLRDEKQTRDEIKAAMRDKHNNTLIEQVHPYWWNTYISKIRTGPLPSSPPLFSLADLKGTDGNARALTQTDGFVQPLLAYFMGNRKTADANDFYSHVFGTQNPQRKAFLQALGSPVPAELKRLAASRLPAIADESFRKSLEAGVDQLGPGSYKVGVAPYGQFDLPTLRAKEHSDYFPENIKCVVDGDTVTTTYTTRAGKNFTVVEKGKDRSESLTVTGYDLNLKPSGAPRGITQTPAGFVEGEELNRAHGVADMFGGSGFREGLNLVSTSDHYNKQIQGAAERSIEASIQTFAVLNGVDVGKVSMDLTVTITFGMLVGDILKDRVAGLPWYKESDPESQQRFLDLLRKVSNPPIRRAEQTSYEYVLKANGKSAKYSPPPVGADVWLFVRKSES